NIPQEEPGSLRLQQPSRRECHKLFLSKPEQAKRRTVYSQHFERTQVKQPLRLWTFSKNKAVLLLGLLQGLLAFLMTRKFFTQLFVGCGQICSLVLECQLPAGKELLLCKLTLAALGVQPLKVPHPDQQEP